MKKLILATGNKHKVAEIKDLLSEPDIEISSLADFPDYPETIEDGKTLEENAIKKALEAARYFKSWAIADDTGLEVSCLNGAPGVYSARYAGQESSAVKNNEKLLKELADTPYINRCARFRCIIAIAGWDGQVFTAKGEIEGFISQAPAGQGGFGYDPLFFVPQYNKTFAQLSAKQKNEISHRALALKAAKKIIQKILML